MELIPNVWSRHGCINCRLLFKQKYPERLGNFSDEDIELGEDTTDT